MGATLNRIEQLKSMPILDVAKKLGIEVRRNRALCFIHEDHTPSLSFKADTNTWRCFGCGAGGSVIDLVMARQSVTFRDACNWLESMFLGFAQQTTFHRSIIKHVHEPARVASGSSHASACSADPQVYTRLCELCSIGTRSRDYLKVRGFTKSTIDIFKLGEYRPNQAIEKALLSEFGQARLERCGLVSTPNKPAFGPNFWLWYPSVIIPFFDENEIVYVQARRLVDSADVPKYSGPLRVRKPLFNANALITAPDAANLLLCEGAMDTMAAVQSGYIAVGILGTQSFREEWIPLLHRFCVWIAFDHDLAGDGAAKRLGYLFSYNGIAHRRVSDIPNGLDLAEYLLSGKS